MRRYLIVVTAGIVSTQCARQLADAFCNGLSSDYGNVTVFGRTLIVHDQIDSLDRFRELIRSMDLQPFEEPGSR